MLIFIGRLHVLILCYDSPVATLFSGYVIPLSEKQSETTFSWNLHHSSARGPSKASITQGTIRNYKKSKILSNIGKSDVRNTFVKLLRISICLATHRPHLPLLCSSELLS